MLAFVGKRQQPSVTTDTHRFSMYRKKSFSLSSRHTHKIRYLSQNIPRLYVENNCFEQYD